MPIVSLRKNIAWTFAGNVLYAACQWGMLIALARLGSQRVVGEFALALAISAPVFMFSNLSLRVVQATDAAGRFPFRACFALRLMTTAAALLLISGIVMWGGFSHAWPAILGVAAAKACESLSDVIYGTWQLRERMDRIAISTILRGVTAVVALAGLFFVTGSLAWGAWGMAAAWLAVLLLFDASAGRNHRDTADTFHSSGIDDSRGVSLRRIAQLAGVAFPVGLAAGVMSLEVNVPRYFVEAQLGIEALGIFAALGYAVVASHTLIRAVNQSAIPRLARYAAKSQSRAYRRLVGKLCVAGGAWSLGLFVAGQWLGHWFLHWTYGADYAAHSAIFQWLLAANVLFTLSLVAETAMRARQHFWTQLTVSSISVICLAGAAAWLVAGNGLQGAAHAVAIAAAARLAAGLTAGLYSGAFSVPAALRGAAQRPGETMETGAMWDTAATPSAIVRPVSQPCTTTVRGTT